MVAIIKLKDNVYIEWSKVSDHPASTFLNLDQVKEILANHETYSKIINQSFDFNAILKQLESNGSTSDVVNLDFILTHNPYTKDGYKLTVDELIVHITKDQKNNPLIRHKFGF